MKKSSALLIAAALILSSCGVAAQYASSDDGQKFQDGIYNNTPSFRTKEQKEESENEAQALKEKTQASQIYLFGDKKDTVMIPKDMSAMIKYDQKLGGTVVTVGENPYDWRFDLENNYGYYYGPYSIGSSWYWSRHYAPWYWNSWSYTPWRYHGWYDPFYIGGWYDPWYYSGWFDPWYYGGHWGWYDPWYHHHHYCGWYGAWDPYWGHHHGHGPGYGPDRPGHGKEVIYGPKDRVFSSGTSIRGGIGNRVSTVSSGGRTERVATRKASSTRVSTTERKPISRTSAVKTSPASKISSAKINNSRVSSSKINREANLSNHRKPAVSNPSATRNGTTVNRGSSVSTERNSGYRPSSSSERSSGYERSSSTRSSSSYNRSSSSSSSRSGFSSGGGGVSRSSGSSGGGYSRSSGGSRSR